MGDAERQIAEKFQEASLAYNENPVALHLRAMNMLYEGIKENSTVVLVPSSAIDSMQLGGLTGTAAFTMGLEKKKKNRKLNQQEEKIEAGEHKDDQEKT